MEVRRWEIGICGTFDVANYGDLLFPLMAEFELTQRIGAVNMHRFSYHARTPPDWPYEVTSVSELPDRIHRLDAMLIGGGFLIRFDKQIAPSYAPPTPGIHHPTGYWLTPALLALQHNVPLIWNSPGMHCNEIPPWANPLMETALNFSRYIAARDELSRARLQLLTSTPVTTVPDTAFGLQRLLNIDGPPSPEFTRLSAAAGLDGPYMVVQAALEEEEFIGFLERHAEQLRKFKILALPIGPALGEHHKILGGSRGQLVRLSEWPGPLAIAELISRSEAVVGHSLHLMITALGAGVPVFAVNDLSAGKYSSLRNFDSVHEMPRGRGPDLEWFLGRAGRKAASATALAAVEALRKHWDRVAAEIQAAERAPTSVAMNHFWQQLPALLEAAARAPETHRNGMQEEMLDGALANSANSVGTDAWQGRWDLLVERHAAARAEAAALEDRIAQIKASMSWRVTAPARFAGRFFRRQVNGNGKENGD